MVVLQALGKNTKVALRVKVPGHMWTKYNHF